ncbi:MAG: DsbA family protein [Chloroflexi bacterium]|nr:DsbA family protein [Chloroflexota bacterium]
METPIQSDAAPNTASRNTLLIAVIIGVAVIAAGAAILLANNAATVSTSSYEGIPLSRLSDGGFVMGNPDAPVTIVEFADYACSHCIDYLQTVERFVDDYVKTGKARFEYRTFPTAGGELTYFMGRIAVCLNDQRDGAFWEAKDRFYQMAAIGRYDGNSGRAVAQELGLDYNQALACAQSQTQVDTDIALGQQEGVSGTPAVLIRANDGDLGWIEIGGQKWDRGGVPYEVLIAVVEAYS